MGRDDRDAHLLPTFLTSTRRGIPIKNRTALLAAASLGVVALGATACRDDHAAAGSPAPSMPPTASVSSSAAMPSPPVMSPSARPSKPDPTVPGSNVIIMIDPQGKKYTRLTMMQMAAGMEAVQGKLPSNFCAISYRKGVQGGGKFPAGRQAFIEACQEGVRLARSYGGGS